MRYATVNTIQDLLEDARAMMDEAAELIEDGGEFDRDRARELHRRAYRILRWAQREMS